MRLTPVFGQRRSAEQGAGDAVRGETQKTQLGAAVSQGLQLWEMQRGCEQVVVKITTRMCGQKLGVQNKYIITTLTLISDTTFMNV